MGRGAQARRTEPAGPAGDLPVAAAGAAPGAERGGRRAVVHIGLDKTGSTTIQYWLRHNAGRLRKRGVVVDLLDCPPPAPRPSPGSAAAAPAFDMVRCFAMYGQLADQRWMPNGRYRKRFALQGRRDLEARVAEMMARAERSLPAAPSHGVWIATSEHLGTHLLSREAIRRQHEWISRRFARVDYVCYVRDQVGWVPSAYAQAVKAGSVQSLDAFIEAQGRNDYHALARRWTAVVGEGRFHLRLFDEVVAGGDLLDDFAAAAGLDPTGLRGQRPVNRGLAARGIRAQLLLNRLHGRLAGSRLGSLAGRLGPLVDLLDRGPRLRLSARQAERVRALNRDGNEALRRWLFPDRPSLFAEGGP